MRIANKVLVIIGVAVFVGLSGILSIAFSLMLDDFRAVEEENAERDLVRVREAFDRDVESLGADAREFADIVAAILIPGDGNATEGENGTDDQTMQLGISLFLGSGIEAVFFQANLSQAIEGYAPGQQTLGIALDRTTLEFSDPDADLNRTVQNATFLASAELLEPATGIIDTGSGVYSVASYPLNAYALGLDSGHLVLARPLTGAFEENLAKTTQLDIELVRWSDLDDDAQKHLAAGSLHLDRAGLRDLRAGTLIEAWDGTPAYAAYVQDDRAVFRGGVVSMAYLGATSYIITALMAALVFVLLRSNVTGRITTLAGRVKGIQTNGHKRVGSFGRDEIGALATAFDDLLGSLEHKQEELARSNAELDRFASVVTHDLKAPLSTFRLNLAMLRSGAQAEQDEQVLERIARMERGVAKMSGRIDHLLAYAHAGGAHVATQPVAMDDVLRGVLEDLAADIGTTGAQVQSRRLPTVDGDPALLGQVMQNLVANAVKYRDPDRTPRIRIWGEGDRTTWKVHIQDNGRGFDPADARRLMRPFVRLDNAEGVDGKGLGLATCARIVEAHGGSLQVAASKGQGARFTIVLPRRPAPGQAPSRPMRKAAAA